MTADTFDAFEPEESILDRRKRDSANRARDAHYNEILADHHILMRCGFRADELTVIDTDVTRRPCVMPRIVVP